MADQDIKQVAKDTARSLGIVRKQISPYLVKSLSTKQRYKNLLTRSLFDPKYAEFHVGNDRVAGGLLIRPDGRLNKKVVRALSITTGRINRIERLIAQIDDGETINPDLIEQLELSVFQLKRSLRVLENVVEGQRVWTIEAKMKRSRKQWKSPWPATPKSRKRSDKTSKYNSDHFKCFEDYNTCCEEDPSIGQRAICLLLFASCLATQIIPLAGGGKGD